VPGLRRTLLLLLAAALVLPVAPASAAATRHRWLHTTPSARTFTVAGSQVLGPDRRPFVVHGVARPSLEWSCTGQGVDGAAGIPASDFATMHTAWGANTVRLALSEQLWLSSAVGMPVAQPCAGYVRTVRAAVAAARAAGLVVILDLHWSDAGSPLLPAAQHCAPDAHSNDFWRSVATEYQGDTGVWFELYNEPHDISWQVWRDGGPIRCDDVAYTAVGMQQLVDTVRATGARNLVLAGGLDWAYDLSGVASAPLVGSGIVYATHPYIWKGGASSWDHAFGGLSRTAPVVATEFGRTDCAATAPYDGALLDYLRAHRVGYTAWAWWAGGCAFPSLLADPSGTCTAGGCAVQADLLAWRAS
jgi:endoglucanase